MSEALLKALLEMSWDEKKEFVEIDTRGRVLRMAVDIEFSLMVIMAFCSPDPYEQKRKFKKMTMGEKIQNTVADLKDFNQVVFGRYKDELDKLEEFRVVRNDFAHHSLEFHLEGNLRRFRVRYIDLYEGKERLHYREYTAEYLIEFVRKYRALNLVLARLVEELKAEFEKGGT